MGLPSAHHMARAIAFWLVSFLERIKYTQAQENKQTIGRRILIVRHEPPPPSPLLRLAFYFIFLLENGKEKEKKKIEEKTDIRGRDVWTC